MASPAPSASPRVKPLLRGVSHEIAAFGAVFAWIALFRMAPSGRAAVAAGVYGGSLTLLFAASAIFHRPMWTPRVRGLLQRVAHSAIYALIAGTYTPMCLLLGGRAGMILLVAVWAGAALGMLQAILWPSAPKPLVAFQCVALGWLVVPLIPRLASALGAGGLALLVTGGLLYTVGAVVYALKRPDPLPRVFGYHEIFHAFVVLAAVCHYAVVAWVVTALH